LDGKESEMTQVPVVSLKPVLDGAPDGDAKVAEALLPVLQSWGAFQLRDHGVPQSVIDAAFAATRRFHEMPLDYRMTLKIDRNNRGYAPMHQSHYPGNKPDLKESFNVGMGLTEADPDVAAGKPLHGVNRWPELEGFRSPVEAYFDELTALGKRLLGPLAICLDMPAGELRRQYSKPIAFMRLFHYPPDSDVDQREFGAAEHKDYGFLTILAQDANGGLEVRSPNNELVGVPPRTDQFVVNVGDLLSEITGGNFVSPLHRVVNRSGVARYSIPFFFDPDFDARFPGMADYSAGEFLLRKFDKFYQYRKEMAAANG
jgi:isopenicillin N synthase-like dioxygenase